MFGFSKKSSLVRCAAIIDIGSGSVGVAIVKSEIGKAQPEIIWTHREYALIRDVRATSDTLKQITTSLVNVFLELGSAGRKALKNHDGKLEIEHVQVAISAPWSYTVTKSVSYSDEHPFTIDERLIEELSDTAEKQARSVVKESGLALQDLELITENTINLQVNGYNVSRVLDKKGRTLSISHTNALANKKILETLRDSVTKILPKASISINSFIYTYYCMLKNMHPDTSEICLVDVTSEATEVAVIRDGILKHVTHGPYGTYTLAREIALACNIPKEEAYTFLKGGVSFVETKLSPHALDQLRAIVSAYELKIATLFKSTGDELSIPKTVFLHTDINTEEFFKEHIRNAAGEATHGDHTIHQVTSKLLNESEGSDTAILLSANFFHQDLHCDYEID